MIGTLILNIVTIFPAIRNDIPELNVRSTLLSRLTHDQRTPEYKRVLTLLGNRLFNKGVTQHMKDMHLHILNPAVVRFFYNKQIVGQFDTLSSSTTDEHNRCHTFFSGPLERFYDVG